MPALYSTRSQMFSIHDCGLQHARTNACIGQMFFLHGTKSNMFPANRFPRDCIAANRTRSQLGGKDTAIRQFIRGDALRTKMLSCH
ncbi:hypothetical protein D3C75_691240 [compost metagenome]